MGDILKKVKSGDPLRIPAQTFNVFVDMAKDYQGRKMHGGQFAQREFQQSGIVLVKNSSGADCDRFGVLGINGPLFSPTINLESFKNKVVLVGVTPTERGHSGNFVILQEPMQAGAIGSAWIAGACPALIDITDELHTFADVNDGQTATLKSGPSGAASIIWAESGTGQKWAIVQIGLPIADPGFIAAITNTGPESEPDRSGYQYWVKEQFVNWVESTKTLYVSDLTGGRYVIASSLDERKSSYYTHSLPTDETVLVHINVQRDSNGETYYYFIGPSMAVPES